MQSHLDEAIQQGVTELSQNRVSVYSLALPSEILFTNIFDAKLTTSYLAVEPSPAPVGGPRKKISDQLSSTLSPDILKQLKEELREELFRENLKLKTRRKLKKQIKNTRSKL